MNARIPDEFAQFSDAANAAFNYTARDISPLWNPGPSTTGSSLGVPPATAIAGMTPGAGSAAADRAYTTAVMQRPASSHPLLWALILFMVGIVLLGAVAHLETKRRG